MEARSTRSRSIRSMLGRRGPSLAAALVPAWFGLHAGAQTVVTGGDPATVITAEDLQAAGELSFVQGDGSAGTLEVTTSGTFSNSWSLTDAIAIFNLTGTSLTIASAVPHAGNLATGTCSIGVIGGALTLGENSFLTGFTGALQASSGGSIIIQQADWFTATSAIDLDSTSGTPTLTWDAPGDAAYAGTIALAGGGNAVISTVQDGSSLTLSGAISGDGDLTLRHTGVTADPTIILALTGGFSGQTILESANVRIDTQESIGSTGLTLDGATLTAGIALNIGAGQTLVIANDSTIFGALGPTALTVDGVMDGSGNLTLDAMDVTINGTTSTYTGAVTLQGGSTLTVSNAAWLASAAGLSMNADGAATTFTWDSADDATFAGTLDVGTGGVATIATTQDTGSITLSGAVSGTGDLLLQHTGVSADPTIILALTGGFTGQTIVDSANVRIDTQESIGSTGLTLDLGTLTAGTDLTIDASQNLVVADTSTIVGTGTGGALTSLTVDGEMQGSGNLTIDAMALTVNGATGSYTGDVSLQGGSALTVSNDAWLGSVGSISMNADDAATSLTYAGAAAGTYAGTLNLGNGTATISSTENFSLTGTVSGTGDLLVTRSAGSVAEIGLGFTAGTFSGTTIVSSTAARLLTANSIGDAGLTLANGDLAIDATLGSLTIGAAQDLTVTGTSSITGSGGASALTVDGDMAGNGTLAVEGLAMTVNGAASAFTGGVALGSGSSLATGNTAWVEGLGALRFDASATVEYTGAADATFDGLFSLSADPATPTDATFRSVGAGSGGLTLSGFASGSGNLVVENTGGSTAAFTLALTGTFDGTTTVNDADVTINTQGSVGQDGLTLNTTTVMDATIGAPLAFGSAQLLTIGGTVNMSGGTANAAIDAQGGLHSAAAATLNLDDIDLTVGDGTASTFTGDISLTDGASLTLDGADLGAVDLASIAGGAEVTFGGVGTIGSIGDLAAFSGRLNLGDLGASASSVLNVTGNASLAAASILRSHFLSTSGGTGTADQLAVGGAFAAGSSTASLVFDPTVFDASGGTWIPTPGDTDTYTVVTATGGFNGTFGTVNVVTIDPITGLPTTRTLDQGGETRFLGAGFSVDYTGTAFSVSILGIGGPDPLPVPGTTNTNVIVPVDVGGTIVNRNANVGVVQNQQINQSAAAMNVLAQTATGDTEFVATQLLLQSGPAAYASSVVAVSAPTNPYALPTTLMLGMSEAGDLAMERLMQLRPQMTAPQAPPRQRGTGGPRSTAVAQSVASTRRKAFGAELNGPTPDEGMRGWARGFGFTGSFSNQSWAKTSYDSTLGNVAAGVDTVLGDGGILGGFVGYMPGSVNVTGGLADESMTLNGVDFGMYGSWVPNRGDWYLSGAVMGAYTMIDRTRNIYVPGAVRAATSSSNAWSASFMGETGFNLPAGGDSYLSPYVRVAYNYFNQGSYTESGAGSMNLSVGSQSASALQPSVGARYMDGIRSGRSVITPFVGAAFTAFVPVGDWGVTATNPFTALPPISVYGDVEALYGASVEAGVEVALPDGLTFFASFNGMFLSDTQVLGGRAGIQIPF